ncbi:MAG: tRNA-dependent cyclodipeptide synthase [candidate division Zixibacteria bacterium]|nr:tRNA-dependent cyclodipeptide synthase [candidate division Zixibacteria bacterium]MBU1469294.1 tRNA-dependent cyclodipeptide synthase [candidate division Zixibacteria bacterium]MBU2626510.1 tRNA-dependent cyclodipeptide synthase [candidate division Zixibacteria bacterium]
MPLGPKAAYLGISLSRRYYSNRRLHKYVQWAQGNAARFAFLIGDNIYALTDSVFSDRTFSSALVVALERGREFCERIETILIEESYTAEIIRWNELESHTEYQRLLSTFQEEYMRRNSHFAQCVRQEVVGNLKRRLTDEVVKRFDSEEEPTSWNILDSYVLREMAGLITMSEYLGFSVEVYPGPDVGILNMLYKNVFPSLTNDLPETTKREFISLSF